MKLYLLRHAEAAARNPKRYPDDSLRPLTEKGYKQLEQVSRFLSRQRLTVDLIFSSPFLRTLETAQFIRKSLELKKDKLIVSENLAPLGNRQELITEIKARQSLQNILLVYHEPDLSLLISLLVTGDPYLFSCRMKKASLCCLSVDNLLPEKCATLEWLWHPGF